MRTTICLAIAGILSGCTSAQWDGFSYSNKLFNKSFQEATLQVTTVGTNGVSTNMTLTLKGYRSDASYVAEGAAKLAESAATLTSKAVAPRP